MKLDLPEKEKISKKTIIIYIFVISVCIIAILATIGVVVINRNETRKNIITSKTEEQEEELKANFETLFNCTLENNENYEIDKKEQDKDIIYTKYSSSQKSDNNYDLQTQIPYININSSLIDSYNKKIYDIFQGKVENVLSSKNENIVYTVKYQAYIENNILSLIIYSDLKQSSSPQRVIVQTFNVDLDTYKEITLQNMINRCGLDNTTVQNKINKEIKEEQNKANDLIALGYEIYSRDLNSDIYEIKNTTEFFTYNKNLYIVYAYGNDDLTREMDIVVM